MIAGGRIVAVADPGVEISGLAVDALDLRARVSPGFIDNHVHVLGGGGARLRQPGAGAADQSS